MKTLDLVGWRQAGLEKKATNNVIRRTNDSLGLTILR